MTDDQSQESNASTIIARVIYSIGILICIAILISLIYSHHIAKLNQKVKPIVLKATYCCIISFIVKNSFSLVREGNGTINSVVIDSIIIGIIVFSWDIAQGCIYILLMLRLHHSFRGTKYAVSHRVYILFVILMVLWGILSLIYVAHTIIIIYESNQSPYHEKKILHQYEEDTFGAYIIGVESVDLIISILLIYLFMQKMIDVTVDLHNNQSDKYIDDQIAKLNEQQKLLLDISAKYFILSFVATIWTQLTTFMWFTYWIALYFESTKSGKIIFDIFIVVITMDTIINPICLYLLFDVNHTKYQKLCKGCHSLARLCFKKCTQKKRVNKIYQNVDESLQTQLLQL